MEVVNISAKEYLLFMKSIYINDSNFKDNKSGIFELVCGENRPFFKQSRQKIIAVTEKGKTLCACVLIIHKNAPQMLCFSFFEGVKDCQKAVNLLIDSGEKYGRENQCHQMVVSLEGHVNNGVAFPTVEKPPSFGESYCPDYYSDFFLNFKKIKFTSFYADIDFVQSQVSHDMPKLDRFSGKISFECADFGRGFTKTMRRYTDLNNEIFSEHRYYFKREYNEDYDLFNDMRPILKNENLIFARCEGKDIGFILWYPDFNQFVKIGKTVGILTFIKYKILRQTPRTAKVVEIGVCKNYRRFGVILMLFNAAIKQVSKNTNKILSSWILDSNTSSKTTTQRYTPNHYKDYYTYEKEL